jgi:hypothetical protein
MLGETYRETVFWEVTMTLIWVLAAVGFLVFGSTVIGIAFTVAALVRVFAAGYNIEKARQEASND